jgi:Fur family transcriptional regulator, ferric uptake regulator
MDTTPAREAFERYLKKENYRITPERFTILDAVMESEGHFDADELFLTLKQEGKKVSRATVYNTLELLLDGGLISKYRFGENQSRYEKIHGRGHHHHMICLSCGDIIEFRNEKLNKMATDICLKHKFKPNTTSFQVYGTCDRCQQER